MYETKILAQHHKIVNDNGETVCCCNISKYDYMGIRFTEKPMFYLSSFVTVKQFRRKGYARMLLQNIKKEYKGCFIVLQVSSVGEMTNDQLIEFYKSEGFKVAEELKHLSQWTFMYIEL